MRIAAILAAAFLLTGCPCPQHANCSRSLDPMGWVFLLGMVLLIVGGLALLYRAVPKHKEPQDRQQGGSQRDSSGDR